ncbi:MAG: AAA family ATPase [Planctomycetota bacterium]
MCGSTRPILQLALREFELNRKESGRMYQQHWGLNRPPFSTTGKRFFQSESQQEALARVEYLVGANRRLGLLVGAEGVGKTTTMEFAWRRAHRSGSPTVYLNLLGLDEQEFVLTLAEKLGTPMNATAPPVQAWRRIFDSMASNRYQNRKTLILLDDAHEADSDVLSAVARMVQWKPSENSGVTTILSTANERHELIGQRLLELCDLAIEVTPWEHADTESFLRGSLEAAGSAESVFDADAIDTIQEISRGVPRRIAQLAELALVAGAGADVDSVDEELVLAVNDELRLPMDVSSPAM